MRVGFWHEKRSEPSLVLVSGYNKLLGKNFQEVYFLHFFVKLGVGRAQLGVFGHSGAIEAIYFIFRAL
jgi:hypothetical protein